MNEHTGRYGLSTLEAPATPDHPLYSAVEAAVLEAAKARTEAGRSPEGRYLAMVHSKLEEALALLQYQPPEAL